MDALCLKRKWHFNYKYPLSKHIKTIPLPFVADKNEGEKEGQFLQDALNSLARLCHGFQSVRCWWQTIAFEILQTKNDFSWVWFLLRWILQNAFIVHLLWHSASDWNREGLLQAISITIFNLDEIKIRFAILDMQQSLQTFQELSEVVSLLYREC